MAPSKKFLQPINLLNAASDPSSADRGDFYYNTASEKIRYYDGTQWNDVGVGTGGGTSIIVSETEPTPTAEGEAWFKSSTSELFIWDGTYWIEATSVVSQLFYVSGTTPSSPQVGTGWLDTTDDSFYIYDGTSWINPASSGGIADIVSDTTPQLGGDLDGNGFGIDNIDYIDFDTTTTTQPAEGMLVWDDGEGTLQLGAKGGNVNISVGQEMVVLCYNGSGSPMSDGDVVYVQGAQGQRPNITLASAASEAGSSKTLGIVTEPIAAGAEGFVTTFGVVNNVNTLGFTEGAALWLSTTAGEYTQTQPQSPNHLVFIGYCLNASETAGRIFVEPQNGYELEELHNVLITSESDNDIVSYESATGLWKNQNLAAAIGEVDGAGSGIDADLLDGQQGTYFLDWTNTTNKPDPTITLGGDLTGSVTLTDLASGTLTASVVDNSHNHTSSNISDFTEATQDVVGGMVSTNTESGISVTYDDTNGKLNFDVNDPIITLSGDVTGSGTITNLGNVTITATVVDDSHNHIISNVDGLQTALDGKQPLDGDLTAIAGITGTSGLLKKTAADTWSLDTNTYLTGNQTITLTGDVSGSGTTSIFVTVADDSHNHIISNVDGLQTALDAKLDSSSYTAADVLNKIKTVDGSTSGLDADLLDGQDGSHYLDWTNITNKPDPTITLGGDASGSLTLTDLAGGTLTVTISDDSHNHIISNVDGLQTALDAKAPLESPALTGTPTAPTASASANSTQIATTAFVQTAVSNLINGAPGALDTLDELAAALGDDANFATTITNSLATKQPLDADLTAIAGLAGTSGFLKKTAADTWSLDTNTYLTGNQTITLSGDVSGSGTTSITVTVADDSHNHIISNVDGLQTALDGKQPLDADLTSIAALSGTSGFLKKTAADTWALDTNTYLTGNQTITLTGDVSGSGTTSISVTVADDSHNHIISNVDGLQTALDAKAPLASPALTGTPTAPTASAGTNSTQIATTAFVTGAGYGKISYQTTAPSSPSVGQIWVDSDETVTSLNSNDFLLKSGGTVTGNLTVSGTTTLGTVGITTINGPTTVDTLTVSTKLIAEDTMTIALSDETTSLTTGTAKVTFRAPFAMTLTQIPRASLSSASTSGLVTVDINEGGTSILGTNKLSIDANEKTSTTAATATTLSDASIADDAEITFDIDAAGTDAKGLKITLYYKRA